VTSLAEKLTSRLASEHVDWHGASNLLHTISVFWNTLYESDQFWGLIALLSLLLRYIIGSAIHLNHVYVKRIDRPDDPVSQSFFLLFKDLMFLVAFGIIVLSITNAMGTTPAQSAAGTPPQQPVPFDFSAFVFGSMLFLFGGLKGRLPVGNCAEISSIQDNRYLTCVSVAAFPTRTRVRVGAVHVGDDHVRTVDRIDV